MGRNTRPAQAFWSRRTGWRSPITMSSRNTRWNPAPIGWNMSPSTASAGRARSWPLMRAMIGIDRTAQPFFQFDGRAVAGTLPKGERLYAMGDPLDLGSSIVDGTYNGLVDRSYADRYHFTGAINSGMSGGPAVSGEGRVAGINVAKQLNGELVGFLVPARFAAAFLAQSGEGKPPAVKDLKAEIGRQLTARQSGFYRAIEEAGFRPAVTGPYRTLENAAPWFTCWAQTNTDQIPKPHTIADLTSCFSDSRL